MISSDIRQTKEQTVLHTTCAMQLPPKSTHAEIDTEPAVALAKIAGRYSATVVIKKDNRLISAKNLLGLLALFAGKSGDIEVHADGADADRAIHEIREFFVSLAQRRDGRLLC